MYPGPAPRLSAEQIAKNAAQNAYAFAFSPTTKKPNWSSIGVLLTNGIAKVGYLIPVAGYFILYSDFFAPLFEFSKLSKAPGLLSLQTRVNMIYYGSWVLLAAYGLYLLRIPELLRNQTNVHRFVADVLSAQDYSVVYRVLDEISTHLRPLELQYLPPAQAAQLKGFAEQIEQKKEEIVFSYDSQNVIPNALRYYYHWKNNDSQNSAALVSMITTFAYILLLAPAADLFLQVFQTTTGLRLPVLH